MYSAGFYLFLIQVWTLTGQVYGKPFSHEDYSIDNVNSRRVIHTNQQIWLKDDAVYISDSKIPFKMSNSKKQVSAKLNYNESGDETDLSNLEFLQSERIINNTFKNNENLNNKNLTKTRFRRATSKFTGLVVGALKDKSLMESVSKTMKLVETSIWSAQSQFTKPYLGSTHGSAAILGTFNSDFRTNFHGYSAEAHLRKSGDYSIVDLNSLTTLLILQSLTEASMYGSFRSVALSNMSIAVESLKSFHSHTHPRGSSVLTMWPEKLIEKKWANMPESIVGSTVKDNTTYSQLEQIAKTCNCEPARTGVQMIQQNKLCLEYFSKPVSQMYRDTSTPPDFTTSFSNLALGGLLVMKNNDIYKAQSELWQSANSDILILIEKLKSMIIIIKTNTQEQPKPNVTENNKETAAKNIEIVSTINNNENRTSTIADRAKNPESVVVVNNVDLKSRTVRSAPESNVSVQGNKNKSSDVSTPANSNSSSADISTKNIRSIETVATNKTALMQSAVATSRNTTSENKQLTPATATAGTGKIKPHKGRINQTLSSESYYSLRGYLDHVLLDKQAEVMLIPSLISDDENTADSGVGQPFNDGNVWHNDRIYHAYNNVNLVSTATTIHALVTASVSGLIDIQNDVLLQKIVNSSLQLLTWFMNNTQDAVTMVTLSNYPSIYQLYWITSRIAFQLNSIHARATKMFQFADQVIATFLNVLRDKMTFSILQSITDSGLGQDGKTRVYIDNILGTHDMDDKGKIVGSGDDRLITSSLAATALIATWTVYKDNKLEFISEISDPVRIAINSLTNYIVGAVTDQTTSHLNAFMSETVKNCETLPARYPANNITNLNGAQITPESPDINYKFGVNGYIPKEEYQKLLDQPRFGFKIRGGSLAELNSPTSVFRFWSSPEFTKAVALQAISQAANIQTD